MHQRNPWLTALLGGAGCLLLLTPQAGAQRPRATQPAQQERETAGETLRLPPDQPIVEVTVQAPPEVRVGQSFNYQIYVRNNSQNVAVHDLVIAQHAGEGFEIESSEVLEKRSSRQAQANRADQQDQRQPRIRDQRRQQRVKQQNQAAQPDDQQAEDERPPQPDRRKRDEAKSDQAKSDQATSDQATSDQATSDQATSDQATSDEAKTDDAQTDSAQEDDAERDKAKDAEQKDKAGSADAQRKQEQQAATKDDQADSEQAEATQERRGDSQHERSARKSQSGEANGSRWKIDRLMPGESQTIRVTALSDSAGTGNVCVAVESYVPAVCLTTRFTKPELEIVKQAPETANICDEIQFEYLVKNTGTGDLQRFTVRDDLPAGLQTIDGAKKLEFTLDDGLKAGATRKFVARLRASDVGEFTSRALVEGSDGVEARSNRAGTRITKADLAVAIDGPEAQAVGGLANYTVRITNHGDAPAPGAQLRVYFPRSADLVRAGQPSKSSREVTRHSSQSSGSDSDQALHQHASPAQTGQDQTERDAETAEEKSGAGQADDANSQEDQQPDDQPSADQQPEADADDQERPAADRDQAASQEQKDNAQSEDAEAQDPAVQDAEAQTAESQVAQARDPQDRSRRQQSRENQQRQQMGQHHWQLGTLRPGETMEVTYVLRPYEDGELEQVAVAEYVCETAQDREMLESEATTATEILMLTGLRVTVIDDRDPVPVGQNVTYTITVLNQGNAPAHEIEISAKLPEELKYLESKGASAGESSGNEVIFKPVEVLEPGKQAVWQIVASVSEDVGDKTQNSIDVELNSDDLEETIVSQEPTTLFKATQKTARSTDEEEDAKK